MTDKQKEVKKNDVAAAEPQKTVIRWDDSKMSSSYANVCNVSSTREEVTVLFGTNQAWHTGQKELTVQLSDRVVLNPYAAKRLSLLLSNVMGEYEKRFGKLEIDVPEK
jgi:hypothetical protein